MAAAGLSVLVHGVAVAVFVRFGASAPRSADSRLALGIRALRPVELQPKPVESPDDPTPEPAQDAKPMVAVPPPEPMQEVEEVLIRPGIDESPADARAWKGYAEETEHGAREAAVEQAAFTPKAGSLGLPPSDPGDAGPPKEVVGDPREADKERPAPAAEQPPADLNPTALTPGEARTEKPAGPSDLADPADLTESEDSPEKKPAQTLGETAPPSVSVADRAPRALQALFPPPVAADARSEREASRPGASTRGGSGGPNGTPGAEASDESDAGSLKNPFKVKWGKVLAGKGVAIKTSKPRISTTAMNNAARLGVNNPLVRIRFDREGRVAEARIVGPGTGHPDIDQPLLDAITERWSASGARFAELTGAHPGAALTFYCRVMFSE